MKVTDIGMVNLYMIHGFALVVRNITKLIMTIMITALIVVNI